MQIGNFARNQRRGWSMEMSLLLALVFTPIGAFSQDHLESTDISQPLRIVLENLKTARASETEATAKATEFDKSARDSATRLARIGASQAAHHEEYIKILNSEIGALRTRLEAAKRNVPLLESAKKSLEQIYQEAFQGEVEELFSASDAETDSNETDATIWDFENSEQNTLAAARGYYLSASKTSLDPRMVQIVARCLAQWASKNRRAIALGETRLRNLEEAQQIEIAQNAPKFSSNANSSVLPTQTPTIAPSAAPSPVVVVYGQVRWSSFSRVTVYRVPQSAYGYYLSSRYVYPAPAYQYSWPVHLQYSYQPTYPSRASRPPGWSGPLRRRR